MEAVLDTAFPLAYRDQVLKFLFPLFPAPTSDAKSSHVYSLTRILVTLNSPEMTVNFLNSLVPSQKLLAYQFAFDLVEGGGQDFLEAIRKDLPEGNEVSDYVSLCRTMIDKPCRSRSPFTTSYARFSSARSPSSCILSSSSGTTRLTCSF